jgi:TonB family protein
MIVSLPGPFSVAHAQTYVIDIKNVGSAVPVEQVKPAYPSDRVRRRQEGWVKMHFVVTADGQAIDPIIIDSSGGIGFEEEARNAINDWRFEPQSSGGELPNNLVTIRTRIRRGEDAASSDFIREYQMIMRNLVTGRIEEARGFADETSEAAGLNLYESTMLWLIIGRIEGAEGNSSGKLEAYRRALAINTRRSLGRKDRLGLLGRIFVLQDEHGLYADALRTYAQLETRGKDSKLLAELAPRAAEITAIMAAEKVLTANATIYNPCDCDAGTPLWYYQPERRTFSFANLNGNVQRFEARCEGKRIRGDVEDGKLWTLAPDWGSCRVFVFGDEGATFDFLGHLDDSQDESSGEAAVARSHVLD